MVWWVLGKFCALLICGTPGMCAFNFDELFDVVLEFGNDELKHEDQMLLGIAEQFHVSLVCLLLQ